MRRPYRRNFNCRSSPVNRFQARGHRARRNFEAHDFHATAPRQEPAHEYQLSRLVFGTASDRSVIFATYGQELSDDFGRRVRNLTADPAHQAIFPNCKLSGDSAAPHRFNINRGGAYFAVGRGGPITGRGAHLLIIDDPL
jgi:hypothetical protein